MKKQAKGPKFRKGQVVGFTREHPTRSIYFGKIRVVSLGPDFLYNVDGRAEAEEFLRPLTVREAGPARGRKA